MTLSYHEAYAMRQEMKIPFMYERERVWREVQEGRRVTIRNGVATIRGNCPGFIQVEIR